MHAMHNMCRCQLLLIDLRHWYPRCGITSYGYLIHEEPRLTPFGLVSPRFSIWLMSEGLPSCFCNWRLMSVCPPRFLPMPKKNKYKENNCSDARKVDSRRFRGLTELDLWYWERHLRDGQLRGRDLSLDSSQRILCLMTLHLPVLQKYLRANGILKISNVDLDQCYRNFKPCA